MKFIAAIFFVLTTANMAMSSVELYGGMNIGSSRMDETLLGSSFVHMNSFFVGHWGFGGGGRFEFNFDKFGIGAVADLAWLGDTFERKQSGVVNDMTYRFESYRVLAGASLSFAFGAFSLIGEYYPYVQNTVTYSDDKAENPYRKNDKLKATGAGFGFNYELGAGLGYSVLYRNLVYNNVEMNGTSVVLPTSQYSALRVEDVIVNLVFNIK